MARIIALTIVAMIAFAANTVFARLALMSEGADPLAYTGIRLASGAAVLAVILMAGNSGRLPRIAGSWRGGAALFGYAIFFSVAYLMLGAATGALILFTSVQIGIIGWAIVRGDRPGVVEWLGLAIAFGGIAYLVSPGLVAPDPLGTVLMVIAGLCWAGYTLIGRGSQSPLADTAGNFIRCLPIALPLIVIGIIWKGLDPATALYAAASGVFASGIGYAIWYAVLPSLTRIRAAITQLSVPAISAMGGVLFISESVTATLLIASAAILGGVAIALIAGELRKRT